MPLSEAFIISVSVSAEASSLSSTLISLSAAKAAQLTVPAIARTQTLRLNFNLIKIILSSFASKPGLGCALAAIVPSFHRNRQKLSWKQHAHCHFGKMQLCLWQCGDAHSSLLGAASVSRRVAYSL